MLSSPIRLTSAQSDTKNSSKQPDTSQRTQSQYQDKRRIRGSSDGLSKEWLLARNNHLQALVDLYGQMHGNQVALLSDIWNRFAQINCLYTNCLAKCQSLEAMCECYQVEIRALRETCEVIDTHGKFVQAKLSDALHHNCDLTNAMKGFSKDLTISIDKADVHGTMDAFMISYSKMQIEIAELKRDNETLKKDGQRHIEHDQYRYQQLAERVRDKVRSHQSEPVVPLRQAYESDDSKGKTN
ncbi:hypothetical protein LTR86_011299 [Recurvomyces mirabilis]|nr:hypothetical protein LTR86_011299 [Recurvomyces mirabilis]